MPFVVNKQLVGLAVTGEQRIASAPDLPTFKEAGLPGGDAGTWQGILTTGGTPPAMVARLNAEIGKILETPEIKHKIAEQGGVVKAGIAGRVPRLAQGCDRPLGHDHPRGRHQGQLRARRLDATRYPRIDLQDLLFGLFLVAVAAGALSPRANLWSALPPIWGRATCPASSRSCCWPSVSSSACAGSGARASGSRPFSCGRCLRSWLLSAFSR